MSAKVAIIDFNMGNLFSVRHACLSAGLETVITDDPHEIENADALILPGVGSFGDAMNALRRKDLYTVISDALESEKHFMGICLGMQVLMTEGFEFGIHKGFGFIEGAVKRFDDIKLYDGRTRKIPHVGWSSISAEGLEASWEGTVLESLPDGANMYFVHSYHAITDEPEVILSRSEYGGEAFCSSIQKGSVFACQFHPEQSGLQGLEIYKKFASSINRFMED